MVGSRSWGWWGWRWVVRSRSWVIGGRCRCWLVRGRCRGMVRGRCRWMVRSNRGWWRWVIWLWGGWGRRRVVSFRSWRGFIRGRYWRLIRGCSMGWTVRGRCWRIQVWRRGRLGMERLWW